MREKVRTFMAPAVAATLCFVMGVTVADRGKPAMPETGVPLSWGEVFTGFGVALITTAAYLFLKRNE